MGIFVRNVESYPGFTQHPPLYCRVAPPCAMRAVRIVVYTEADFGALVGLLHRNSSLRRTDQHQNSAAAGNLPGYQCVGTLRVVAR